MTFEHSPRKAAAWMSGWLAAMVVMAVAGREATRSLHVFQIMEMRSLLGLLLLYPLVRASGGLAALRTGRAGLQVARNVFHYAAQFGWFMALTMIPIAQVVAIEFTMPIWTAIIAVSFLGERLGAARIAAVVLGLVGVAVIVRPATGHPDPGQLIALAAAVGFAISVSMVKALTRSDSAVAIIFWMLVVQSAIGLLPAAFVWRTPPPAVLPWIVVIAVCGTYSHYCMTRALQHAEATTTVPMDFLRVPLSALAGWLVYSEAVDLWTVLGAVLILAGNALNLRGAARPRAPAAA
ncbi:MAG: DMT family transporter [Burkholderiales bacterium]|nr:DMT family transporter [Burkholderiales bacterium]